MPKIRIQLELTSRQYAHALAVYMCNQRVGFSESQEAELHYESCMYPPEMYIQALSRRSDAEIEQWLKEAMMDNGCGYLADDFSCSDSMQDGVITPVENYLIDRGVIPMTKAFALDRIQEMAGQVLDEFLDEKAHNDSFKAGDE